MSGTGVSTEVVGLVVQGRGELENSVMTGVFGPCHIVYCYTVAIDQVRQHITSCSVQWY